MSNLKNNASTRPSVSGYSTGEMIQGKYRGLQSPEIIEVERAFDVPGSGEIGIQFETHPALKPWSTQPERFRVA